MAKVRQCNTKKLYFSPRITEAMRNILDYPLTMVEAPMGYGKTTAVRECLNDSHSLILWQTVYDADQDSFWRGFSRLLTPIDADTAHSLHELGFPRDAVLLRETVRIIADIAFAKQTILVVDDYHLLKSHEIDHLIERLAMFGIPGLHIIIITRYSGGLNVEELALKGYMHHIPKETFELTPLEIAEYYKTCGIRTSSDEIERLHALTEGWISALYLLLLEFIKTGSYSPETNIYKLIERTVYEPLTAETKDFLLTLSIFDSFTQEQAAYLWGKENTDKLLSEVTSRNAFVNYDHRRRTYFVHNILSGFLRERLAGRTASERRALCRKASEWLEKNGDYFAAMRYYYECGDFDQCLRSLEADRSHDFTPAKKEVVKKYMMDCPPAIKARHHYAMLKYLVYLFTYHETSLFDTTCDEFLGNVNADTKLDPTLRNRLLGEFELILGVTAYNDIKKMRAHYVQSWALLGRSTVVYDPKVNWTFGSPSVLYLYYRQSGRLAEHVQDLIENIPHYNRLTGGHGSGGESVMEGERLYHMGDFAGAEIAAHKARYKAQEAGQPNIAFCADYLKIRLAVLQGDGGRVLGLLEKMRDEMNSKKDYQLIHLIEICESSVYTALNQKDKISAGLLGAEPQTLRLGFPGFGAFNIFYGRALLVRGEYLKLVGSADYFFGIANIFPNLLGKIYTHIYLAAAQHRLFMEEEALEHLKKALGIALPDTVYMPFVENGDFLKPLLTKLYGTGYYRNDLARILELYGVYDSAVKKIVREHFGKELPKLTERETEIAKMAANGLTNKEIGVRLYISENTVKMALKSIFEKLGVTSRSLLKDSL